MAKKKICKLCEGQGKHSKVEGQGERRGLETISTHSYKGISKKKSNQIEFSRGGVQGGFEITFSPLVSGDGKEKISVPEMRREEPLKKKKKTIQRRRYRAVGYWGKEGKMRGGGSERKKQGGRKQKGDKGGRQRVHEKK